MRFRVALPVLLGLVLVSSMAVLVVGRSARGAAHPAPTRHSSMHMTDADMKRRAESWWASHPPVGDATDQVPAATYMAGDFYFDADNDPFGTPVDTARIMVGEAVRWQWVTGTHTVTNGTDSSDPNTGRLFDQPMDDAHTQFTFQFNSAGTFDFFCRIHELDMRGVVIVTGTTGVDALPRGVLGFTTDPTPNPSRAGARFGFALREAGRARAELFDVRGRLVAAILDRTLDAGPHEAFWDGRTLAGGPAPAGVYYVRLRLPGFTGTRALSITP